MPTAERHACVNHRRRRGRMRCDRCGVWLCGSCSNTGRSGTVCSDEVSCSVRAGARVQRQRARTVRAIVWSCAALVMPCLALFPAQVRRTISLSHQNKHLREHTRRLSAALEDRIALTRQVNTELRTLKDSVLTVLRTTSCPPELPPLTIAGLQFETRLPMSLDNGNRTKRLVALTFDGDAMCNAAEELLDTLRSRGVTATIFITGGFIRRFPEVVRALIAEGHEIGNHTYNHPHLTTWAENRRHTTYPGVTRAMLFNQLGRTERMFEKLTGKRMAPIWRAPYGERNREICRWAQEAGYLHIGWRQGRTWLENLDSNDWVPDEQTPGYHSPLQVVDKIMANARARPYGINGGIVLMHLGTQRKRRSEQVHLVLGRLIDELRSEGYRFVTATTMAREAGINLSLLGGTPRVATTEQ